MAIDERSEGFDRARPDDGATGARPRRREAASRTVVPFPQDPVAADEPALPPLIEAARRDDRAAWSLLYERHYFEVFHHVCAMTGSAGLAEDLTQETFARAMVGLPNYRGQSEFTTWLHGIAVNLVRMHWRKEQRRSKAQSHMTLIAAVKELAAGDLERDYARRRRMVVLYALLEDLSEALREAFVLRYIRGLSVEEAGMLLGVEPGTVRVRAHRARHRLERELARLGWGVAEGPA